jgi:hypothetical protein
MVSNSPLRVQFSLPASPGSISYGWGLLRFINTQFSYSSNYLTYLKEYTTLTNMQQ